MHANGSKLPTMVGAVIYVRVSTKEQTESLSLPTQLRTCEKYCRRQWCEVLQHCHEEGESAKTTDRSLLQNLVMSDNCDGQFPARLRLGCTVVVAEKAAEALTSPNAPAVTLDSISSIIPL